MIDTAVRVAGAARRSGAGWSLLSGADAVCYATGHVARAETGPSPFAGGPALALVAPDGATALLASDQELALSPPDVDRVEAYTSYAAGHYEPSVANRAAALRALLEELGVDGVVGVEDSLDASAARVLAALGRATAGIDRELARARSVKTPRELALLRESGRIAALGQQAGPRLARAGMSELALFSGIRTVMEEAAGERLPVAGDLLSGVERTAGVGGWPAGRVLQEGDPVVADLAPRVGGYWADSCGTWVLGEASPRLRRMHAAVRAALDAGVEALRPGIAAQDLDRRIRAVLEREGLGYPHHTGHGIGASVHEHPRLTAAEPRELEEGMVILLEPGAYLPGVGGVRLEWMLEVTAADPVLLTPFDHVLEPGAS
jgi:Xaa-Pro aminopeptidase